MITTALISVIWSIAEPLLNLIPVIDMSAFQPFISGFADILGAVTYMLPMGTVLTILGIILSLWVLRVVIALLHSLWDALPLV